MYIAAGLQFPDTCLNQRLLPNHITRSFPCGRKVHDGGPFLKLCGSAKRHQIPTQTSFSPCSFNRQHQCTLRSLMHKLARATNVCVYYLCNVDTHTAHACAWRICTCGTIGQSLCEKQSVFSHFIESSCCNHPIPTRKSQPPPEVNSCQIPVSSSANEIVRVCDVWHSHFTFAFTSARRDALLSLSICYCSSLSAPVDGVHRCTRAPLSLSRLTAAS